MDFLLLLPHGQRIVLEVDGSQHYTPDRGRTPDTAKYAADRDLRLSGYEVYRFGHDELRDETTALTLLEALLPRLFQHHEVTGRHGHRGPATDVTKSEHLSGTELYAGQRASAR
jgi:very-short-patch-repair endonuclease